jgi:hypothetical protein
MKLPSLSSGLFLAAVFAMVGVRCTELTVTQNSDGSFTGGATGPDVTPVEIDNEGIREVTPTPGPYDPVYPVTPPPPTRTPRPGSI